MKRFLILLSLSLISCDYFENKKVNTQDIVSQELAVINWAAVDEYPSFSECDAVSQKQERKACFESTILGHVNRYLAKQDIVVSEDVEDTIAVTLSISNKGKISVLHISKKPETAVAIPKIDSLLRGSIATLPKIFPAVKRSQQVNTEFVLPVVVSIQ
jgi:hypothetical protein